MNILLSFGIAVILIIIFVLVDADVFEFKLRNKVFGLILSIIKVLASSIALFYFVYSASMIRSLIIGIGITIAVEFVFFLISYLFSNAINYKNGKYTASKEEINRTIRVLLIIKNSLVSSILISIVLYHSGLLSKI